MSKVNYLQVKEIAQIWNVSERSIRNYCTKGRVVGAVLRGKTWFIPETAQKPGRQKRHTLTKSDLLTTLVREKETHLTGGIYHKIQIDLTFNTNHIEGSRLSHDQTRYIFETNTLAQNSDVSNTVAPPQKNRNNTTNSSLNVDDIIETVNHFRCIDLMIERANFKLTESFIKQLHFILKSGTSDSRKSWFVTGNYKKLANEVGGKDTIPPENVTIEMRKLLTSYNAITHITFDDLLDFHYKFERIHPFQDGNGRVGRLILFKECLKHHIVPFIIDEQRKLFYYRGLNEWQTERGYLRDTCLSCQDDFSKILEYFRVHP